MSNFIIQAQRRLHHQWQPCTDQVAGRWAVVEVKGKPRNGQPPRFKVICAFDAKLKAVAAHQQLCHKRRPRAAAGSRWSTAADSVVGSATNLPSYLKDL